MSRAENAINDKYEVMNMGVAEEVGTKRASLGKVWANVCN